MNPLRTLGRPLLSQVRALENGFPLRAVERLCARLNLPLGKVRVSLQLTSQGRTMSLVDSERILRLARVFKLLREVFNCDRACGEWFATPDRRFRTAPLNLLTTDVGSRVVEKRIVAMRDGIPP